MALGITIEVKIYQNGKLLKKITEPVLSSDDKNKRYIDSLKISQNNVNLYLTTLVDLERKNTAASGEHSSSESGDESSDNDMPKKKRKN